MVGTELNINGVWRTCNKIRAARNRINIDLRSCFTSLDTQRNNLISETNFITVLSGPLGKLIGLSNQEICELADYFRTQDGRIFYKQFCDIVCEEDPNFEKNIPWTSGQEWEDALQTNCLSQSEQRQVDIIISKIASIINRRKLVLRPYFQDYELISKNCGVVTYAHFARILHFLGINLASPEMTVLLKKFSKDSYTMNYVAFIKNVEEAQDFLKKHGALDQGGDLSDSFPGRVVTVKLPKLPRPEVGKIKTACIFPQQLHFLPVDIRLKRIRDVREIMLRIQEHVFKNKLHINQFFQDFDVFNVGKISENQFQRGLDALQASALGKLYLAKEEIDMLAAFYKDPNDGERFCWRTFQDDVEQVFTVKELHKYPNLKVVAPPPEVDALPRKGRQEWECCNTVTKEIMQKIFKSTLNKIVCRVKERSIVLRKYFRDFDKNNRGHISRAQLRQALATASIPLTREEIFSLEYMYNNDIGFHYLDFINKLEMLVEESSNDNRDKREHQTGVTMLHEKRHLPEEEDIDLVLAKIKAKIVCNGIKVVEFLQQYDTRNEKILTKDEFQRGLDLLKCHLTTTEVKTIMDHFAVPDSPDRIDYWYFSEMVEAAMAQGHLEKAPLFSPVKHVPSEATPRSFLNFQERQILMRTLIVLSSYVDTNMEELFKDFDKHLNEGTVTMDQLTRVLSVRNVITKINAKELDILFKCYSGGHVRLDQKFNYRNFLNALYIVRKNKEVQPF